MDSSYADFEWDGKEFKKRIDELTDRTPIPKLQHPPANAAAPATPVAAAANTTLSNASHAAPNLDLGAGFKSCYADDSSPEGTVVDGMKKMITATPFGSNCRWEPPATERKRIMKTIALNLFAALGFAKAGTSTSTPPPNTPKTEAPPQKRSRHNQPNKRQSSRLKRSGTQNPVHPGWGEAG